jgi:Ca2+-binding EF-hand superfamily protein
MSTGAVQRDLFEAFTEADVHDTGKLDLVGFTILLEGLGLSWARNETQDRFERADVNHDGLISFAELEALVQGLE